MMLDLNALAVSPIMVNRILPLQVNRAHNLLMGAVENGRGHDDVSGWDPWVWDLWIDEGLAGKYDMKGMSAQKAAICIEDGYMHGRYTEQ